MLSRLQRLLAFVLASAVLLAAILAWHAGAGVLGWLLALGVIPIGYALALGLEFLWMHASNRNDPAPRASALDVLIAWWGEVLSGPRVFGWRQPWRSRIWGDTDGADGAAGRRGVVFIHGFVCNRGLWNPWMQRLHAAGVPWVAVDLEPVFGAIDAYAPIVEAAVARIERATGRAPIVVCHSMGGLALRRWWVEAGNDARVHHAITIGSPHHGTELAALAISANGRDMRRGGEWLQALAAREPAGRYARFTCFYGHCDNIVFPASTATLPGADNRHLPRVAHVHMADHPAVFAALKQALEAPIGDPPA